MGRLSTFAKNRILSLRFQKSFRIKQIALTLQQEDDIKVSRKSISTFLKKYIETKSINDKPRSGRNKKLTPEEINLIGEITRLNRDITAPKIKEYLNLNVSTYTILRASKLFEWNKLNPNSNEAKKAAALKRQLDGEIQKRRKTLPSARNKAKISQYNGAELNSEEFLKSALIINSNNSNTEEDELANIKLDQEDSDDLKLLTEHEIINAKNASSSAMVFATKILYKIFHLSELLGHNVSGKTYNKYIKNKKALDQKRISYIKWLIETYFDGNKEELWKSCRTAINKSIRNNEIKGGLISEDDYKENKSLINESSEPSSYNIVDLNSNIINESICPASLSISSINHMCHSDQQQQHHHHQHHQSSTSSLLNLEPNMSIFQMSNELPSLDLVLNKIPTNSGDFKGTNSMTSVVTLTDPSDLVGQLIQDENQSYFTLKNSLKKDSVEETPLSDMNSVKNLNILSEHKIIELKSLYCSPMIFATKVLMRIFTKSELLGHNIAGKSPVRNNFGIFNKNQKIKQPLDESRINYIQWLIRTYFNYYDDDKQEAVWKSCRKAINRVIRNIEIKESKLIKSCDNNGNNGQHNNSSRSVHSFEDLSQMIEFSNETSL